MRNWLEGMSERVVVESNTTLHVYLFHPTGPATFEEMLEKLHLKCRGPGNFFLKKKSYVNIIKISNKRGKKRRVERMKCRNHVLLHVILDWRLKYTSHIPALKRRKRSDVKRNRLLVSPNLHFRRVVMKCNIFLFVC